MAPAVPPIHLHTWATLSNTSWSIRTGSSIKTPPDLQTPSVVDTLQLFLNFEVRTLLQPILFFAKNLIPEISATLCWPLHSDACLLRCLSRLDSGNWISETLSYTRTLNLTIRKPVHCQVSFNQAPEKFFCLIFLIFALRVQHFPETWQLKKKIFSPFFPFVVCFQALSPKTVEALVPLWSFKLYTTKYF